MPDVYRDDRLTEHEHRADVEAENSRVELRRQADEAAGGRIDMLESEIADIRGDIVALQIQIADPLSEARTERDLQRMRPMSAEGDRD